jgi:succinoglycan biosynthesis transport protein ExoP
MDVFVDPANIAPPQSQGLQLTRVLRVFRENLPLILALGLVGAVAGYGYALTLPKYYTSTSLIAVEGDRFAIPELQGALRNENAADPMPFVRTEMQALTSRDLVQSVMTKLQLNQIPEFNAELRAPTLYERVTSALRALMPGSDPLRSANPDENVVNAIIKKLTIFQDNRSLAIEVSFTAEDPGLSAKVLNTLVAEYIDRRAQRRVSANKGANEVMTARVEQVRTEIAAIEQQMKDLRSKNEVVLLRAGGVGQQQLEDLATAATRAGVDRAQAETNYNHASALAKQGSSDALADVLGSPTISRLREQESTASERVAQLATRYQPGYPVLQSAKAELDSVRRQISLETQRIVSSLGTQLRVAREREADLKRQLEQARQVAVQSENTRAQMDQLQQEANSRRALYQTLLERAQQTAKQPTGSETPDVYVVSTATPPNAPSFPNSKIAGGLGGLAGSIVGYLIAIARIRKVDKFTDTADLATTTGLSIVSTLPSSYIGRGRTNMAARITMDPSAPEVQAMRELRTKIRHLGRSSSPRIIMFCSAPGGDDAVQIATAYARVTALNDERVLLIDANLQDPSVTRLLGFEAGDLLAVLAGQDWRDVATVDEETPLAILSPSQAAPDSHALLSSIAFQNLLIEARAEFDHVVLTSAAAGTMDALAVVQRAEATLMVLNRKSKRGPAQAAADRLGTMSRHAVAALLIDR